MYNPINCIIKHYKLLYIGEPSRKIYKLTTKKDKLEEQFHRQQQQDSTSNQMAQYILSVNKLQLQIKLSIKSNSNEIREIGVLIPKDNKKTILHLINYNYYYYILSVIE